MLLQAIWEPLLKRWDQPFDVEHRKRLADQAADMFSHAYSSYMKYGYPSDNVKPKSCKPEDVQVLVCLVAFANMLFLLPVQFDVSWWHPSTRIKATATSSPSIY